MKKSVNNYIHNFLLLTLLFYTDQAYSDGDSFEYNLYNNYGVVGTIHILHLQELLKKESME